MNRITIELENCYGIKKLDYTFNFHYQPALEVAPKVAVTEQ